MRIGWMTALANTGTYLLKIKTNHSEARCKDIRDRGGSSPQRGCNPKGEKGHVQRSNVIERAGS